MHWNAMPRTAPQGLPSPVAFMKTSRAFRETYATRGRHGNSLHEASGLRYTFGLYKTERTFRYTIVDIMPIEFSGISNGSFAQDQHMVRKTALALSYISTAMDARVFKCSTANVSKIIMPVGTSDEKDLEAQMPLLDYGVIVEPLRQSDVWNAAKSWYDAFLDDPMIGYLNDDQKGNPTAHKVSTTLIMSAWIRTKVVLTVDGGTSVIVATPAKKGPTNPAHTIIDTLLKWFFSSLLVVKSPEQRKRYAEARTKLDKVIAKTIGDWVKDMIFINLLCTALPSQHRGYASALLTTITGLADSLGQAAWLESSNVLNTGFYNSHGFYTVGEVALGEDNPKWAKNPVVVKVMSSLKNGSSSSIEVTNLHGHAWKAAKTWSDAFETDPMFQYFRNCQKRGFFRRGLDRVAMAALLSFYSKHRLAWTVNEGEAFLLAIPAGAEEIKCKGIEDRIYHAVLNFFARMLNRQSLAKKKQRQRYDESEKKFQQSSSLFLKEENDMFDLMFLATAPNSQHHGYASALMRKLMNMADEHDKRIWLQCSNAHNEVFYKRFGFETVGKFTLEDQQQKNKKRFYPCGLPIEIKLMVRLPWGEKQLVPGL
ncbi:unnamed protein product [Cyclocybe aegerita]|uniref:N-acetyltransferase domain-containing protein n=1 Tax=Cyclocybe aegerita TaxID=1973307 RepID=A0A8S0W2F1_CYCAE|nr:unnamed protein product [Cyclocybe aegerita]